MPKLILKKKAEVIDELILKLTQVIYTIGADETNDLVIHDKRVSVAHAQMERQGNHYFIRDMKSAFGTFVNDLRLDQQIELRNGDEIQIGEHTIVFDNPLEYLDKTYHDEAEKEAAFPVSGPSVAAEPIAPVAERIAASPTNSQVAGDAVTLESTAGTSTDEMAPYYLLAIFGAYAGKKFQLRYGETRIGRDSKLNDIVIRENKKGEVDPSISRRHATVSYHNNAFYVLDKRSKTRTYVNDVVVPEDGEIELRPGDEIEIVSDQQSTIFRFVAEGNWDFSPPQKAGVWWVRYKTKFFAVTAVVAILVGLYLAGGGFIDRAMLTQKPEPFALELVKWKPVKSIDRNAEFAKAFASGETVRPIPAAADFNGDGFVDIASIDIDKNPMLIDGKKNRLEWTVNTITCDINSALIAADVNGNGMPDIVLASANGKVVAIDGNFGAEMWSSPFFKPPFSGPPVVADFDGDGNKDVTVAEDNGILHIGYNRVTNQEWVDVEIGIEIRAPISTADLDGDGDAEILLGSENGLVLIVDGITRKIVGTVDVNDEINKAQGTFYGENQIRFPAGVADLNGDHQADLVISSVQGNLIAIDGATKKRLWYDRLSQELSIAPEYPSPFALGDVDGDHLDDVVVATEQGEIRAYRGVGAAQQPTLIWNFTPTTSTLPSQAIVVCDMDKDRHADAVFLDEDNILHIISGSTGQPLWNPVEPIPEQTSFPMVADLHKDGELDIALASETGRIYQYRSNSRVPKAAIFWGQQFGGNTNNVESTFRLPATQVVLFPIAAGLALMLGGGATIFFTVGKKRH